MKVKKYRAPDRVTALRMVRDDLGPDARIVQEQRVRASFFGLFGTPHIEILAEIEDELLGGRAAGVNGQNGVPGASAGGNGVEASISAAARRAASAGLNGAATGATEDALRRALAQPGGLSNEGASKLAAILETFPKNGQPVPPAMAQTLADLIARATGGDAAGSGEAAPRAGPASTAAAAPATPPLPPAHAPLASPQSGPDGLAGMHTTLQALQTAVDRLAQQQQDAQLPREAPAVRIAYQHLIQQEVEAGLALDIAGQLSEEYGLDPYVDQATVNARVAELLEERLSTAVLRLPPQYEFITRTAPPVVAVLVGATGVGKTTTLAKLASHFAFTQGKKVALITTDTYRIAAAAQLGTYAEILELPLEVVYRPEEIAGAISRHMDADLVLVDTPGCGPHDQAKIGELQQFVDATLAAVPDATVLLTLSGPTKLRDLIQVRQGFGKLRLNGLIFTKLDETTAYGPLVSFAIRAGKPVYYVTTGQRVPNDIEPASRERLARLVFHGLSPEAGHQDGTA